ncbi:UDP-N-acetylglucosamine pyrophosphorylase, partial [Coemansia erecta]
MVQSTPSFTSESLAALKKQYEAASQSHVFKYFDELSDEAAAALFKQLSDIDVERCNEFFDRTTRSSAPQKDGSSKIEPLPSDS